MRRTIGIGLVVFLAGACSASGGDGGATGQPAPTELRLAVGGESEDGYDPTLGWGRYGSPLFHSTLLRRDGDLNVVNDLATRHQVSDDGLVWTVDIRTDARFTDGTPVTTADVAYTFTKAGESGGLTDVTVLDTARALDADTVELKLKKPQSTFVNRLITLGIVPQHAHHDGYGRNPVGSGPFKLVRWDEGRQLIVEANPDYYGQKPAFSRVVLLFAGEDATLALAKAGDVHVASVAQSLATEPIPGMRLVSVDSVDNRGMMLPAAPAEGKTTADGHPIGNAVTSDVAIRQAINVVVDRQALVEGVLDGFGSPAVGPVDGLPWFQASSVVTDNDVASAKKILAAAGWSDSDGDGIVERDGHAARFTLIYPGTDTTRQGLALAAGDMIRTAGIDVEVEGKSWDEIETRMHADAILFGWGSHDQTQMYNLYHSSHAGVGYYNAGYYRSPAVDNYLDLAMGASDPQEADVFWKSAQLDRKGAGFTAKADAAWAWLVNLDHTYYVADCLDVHKTQVEPHGHGFPITAGITSWTWSC
jgi:peptide/nickel transport system substrate-binding protein